jgi:cyclic pyranopterin phosphate synthase
MPERGMTFAHKDNLLTFEEILHLVDMLGTMGVEKIRITGGEPFVRTDLIHLLEQLADRPFLKSIGITSNLTVIAPYISRLKELGIVDVNVSLDAMDATSFKQITRRDEFQQVYQNLLRMEEEGFNLKVNCVVMKGKNEDQIIPLMELVRDKNISVRFLEEMPFNGTGAQNETLTYQDILSTIGEHYRFTKLIDLPNSTSQNYQIDGFNGNFGVIPSFSRTFCGSCNRLRLAATGEVRTCLYGKDELNLRDLLRNGASADMIKHAIQAAVLNKPVDGFAAADGLNKYESMTKLGG